MMIELTDTNGDQNVHINDWMVENGFAEFEKMVSIKKNFVYDYYQQNQLKKLEQNKNEEASHSSSRMPYSLLTHQIIKLSHCYPINVYKYIDII